jgi:hypothetical protein
MMTLRSTHPVVSHPVGPLLSMMRLSAASSMLAGRP